MLNDDQAMSYMHRLLTAMAQAGGSDLFIAHDVPPTMKAHGTMTPMSQQKLPGDLTRTLALSLMNDRQRIEFDREMECNFAIVVPGVSRFRVNVYVQQAQVAMVIRTIANEIPNADQLGLPAVLKEQVLSKRGLFLVVGGTGSGKSTTLAALIDHRNASTSGHIITVEDPIEYVHAPKRCLVSQREVGVDTHSWEAALKNALRQAPDVILMGEVRDRETMEHAVTFAETGHLCLATLHANNANQAIDRIINFFPRGAAATAADGPVGEPAVHHLAATGAHGGRAAQGGRGNHDQLTADRRQDLQGPVPRDQGHHGTLARAGHAHLRLGAVRAVQRRTHRLRGSVAQRRLRQ